MTQKQREKHERERAAERAAGFYGELKTTYSLGQVRAYDNGELPLFEIVLRKCPESADEQTQENFCPVGIRVAAAVLQNLETDSDFAFRAMLYGLIMELIESMFEQIEKHAVHKAS